MNRRQVIFIALTALIAANIILLALIPRAHAATATLNIYPSDDAYVWAYEPDTTHGSENHLHVGLSGSPVGIYRAFFKFSLSSLPAYVNAITDAKLSRFGNGYSGTPSASEACQISDDTWTQGGLTWNNQPSIGSQIESKTIGNHLYRDYFTVTSWVQTQWAGDDTVSIVEKLVTESGFQYEVCSNEYATSYERPYLAVTYSYYPPVNDELTLVDPSMGSQGVCAQKQAYSFRVKVTDGDGGSNLNYVELTLDYGGEDLRFRWTESTDTFSEQNDPMGYVSISSTGADSTLSGNQWTLLYKITFDWDYPDEGLHICLVYSVDDFSLNDADTYIDKYYVENDLAASGLTVSDYRVNPSQGGLTFSGNWHYQGTSIDPPDGNYDVKIMLGAVEKGTDTSLVSGAFSTTGISAEATVGSYSYTTTADHMSGSGAFSAVIVDKISVTISCDDNTPALNQTVHFSVSATYAYDSSPVTTLTFQVTRNGSNYSTSTPFTDMQSTFVLYSYTTSSASETTYTLNTFTTNTQSVGWGFSYTLLGAYTEDGIRTGAINVTFYRKSQSTQNIELDGSYAFTCGDYIGSVFSFELGYNESRTYYLRLGSEDIYVFKPSSPYYTYFFTIIDFAGIHNGYLESIININGTERVVERWKLDFLYQIPFTMEWSRAYTMKLICDEGTYVLGTFVAGATTSFQLPVYKALFPQDAVAVEGVFINVLRINNTRVQINYTDSLALTNWVQVKIYQLPLKQLAYSTNNTGQTQVINWDLANPVCNYYIEVLAASQQWAQQTWKFTVSAPITSSNPWTALDNLGTLPFAISQIVGCALVLLVFGAFDKEHSAIGGIVAVLLAAFFVTIGFLNIPASWLALCMGLALLIAISINRKKAEGVSYG